MEMFRSADTAPYRSSGRDMRRKTLIEEAAMTRVIRNPAVVCTDLDDGAVLLDLDTTAYYSLNRTAVGIWKLIGDEPMVEAIAARVAEKYAVDQERALASVKRLIATLEHEKLIRTESP
jgi:hypothetical protein